MDKLEAMLKEFLEAYTEAPLYGGYSRTLKRKIESKQQVKMAFIENISMIGKLYPDCADRVKEILKSFE
jgi:hypothetical protein